MLGGYNLQLKKRTLNNHNGMSEINKNRLDILTFSRRQGSVNK